MRRRKGIPFWLWIVGAVVALFGVSALLKADTMADTTGAALASLLVFGALFLIVWKLSNNRGFFGTMIGGLVAAVCLIGAMTGVESTYNPEAAARTQAIADECGGIGGGDIQCRWDSLVESTHKLAEVAQSPASEGLGTTLLVSLALMFAGGWLLWKAMGQ